MSQGPHPADLSTPQKLYVWLTAFFCASLIIADIVGIKLFRIPLGFSVTLPWVGEISAVEHTCGMLTFPVTFLLTDLINEYYGAKGARRVTFIGFAMAMFVFLVINVSQAMPYLDAPFNVSPEVFNGMFGPAKVMYVASLFAYLAGQMSDIAVFGILKRLTGGRLIWLRATGSTLISQFIDSVVVTVLAFHVGRKLTGAPADDIVPLARVLPIALTGYTLKFVLAIAITPVIYLGHGVIRHWLGMEPVKVGKA